MSNVVSTFEVQFKEKKSKIPLTFESGGGGVGRYPLDETLTVHGAAADAQAAGKMVTVSNQNPNIAANKVWVKKTTSEIQVPTMEEFSHLNGSVINVKEYGAIGDGVTDDTEAFRRMFAIDSDSYYIPKGTYIVRSFVLGTNVTDGQVFNHNVKIYGDGPSLTKLKLKDGTIPSTGPLPSTGCVMFNIEGPTTATASISIEISDLYIDMNRRNNNFDSKFDSTEFDPWYLQYCGAIAIKTKAVNSLNVIARNLEFYDLIADGITFRSVSDTASFDDLIIDKIVSKGRTSVRSDVCIVGDFNSAIVSNCSLDDFEIEVNQFCEVSKHYFVMSNCNIKNKFDITAKYIINSGIQIFDDRSKYIVSNCNIFGKFNCSSVCVTFSACYISLSEASYIATTDLKFINCTIDDAMTNIDNINSNEGMFYCTDSDKVNEIKYSGCDITSTHYKNFIVLTNTITNTNRNYNNLILDNNSFDLELVNDSNYGGNAIKIGNINLYATNNKIRLNGGYNTSFIFISNRYYASREIIIKDNMLLNDCIMMKTGQNLANTNAIMITIKAKNNIRFSNTHYNIYRWIFDEITPYRGGIGTTYNILELDDYTDVQEPTSGQWIKGQIVYNINSNDNNILGWQCITSGTVGSSCVFMPIRIS